MPTLPISPSGKILLLQPIENITIYITQVVLFTINDDAIYGRSSDYIWNIGSDYIIEPGLLADVSSSVPRQPSSSDRCYLLH
jgi:hypothetical protein